MPTPDVYEIYENRNKVEARNADGSPLTDFGWALEQARKVSYARPDAVVTVVSYSRLDGTPAVSEMTGEAVRFVDGVRVNEAGKPV